MMMSLICGTWSGQPHFLVRWLVRAGMVETLVTVLLSLEFQIEKFWRWTVAMRANNVTLSNC